MTCCCYHFLVAVGGVAVVVVVVVVGWHVGCVDYVDDDYVAAAAAAAGVVDNLMVRDAVGAEYVSQSVVVMTTLMLAHLTLSWSLR